MAPRQINSRNGAAVVEMAVVVPLFILFIFAVLEYGRFLMVRNLMDSAAREGARFAVVRTETVETSDIVSHVTKRLAGQAGHLEGLQVQAYEMSPTDGSNIGSWQDATFGDLVAVQINGSYRPILGALLFMPDTIAMQARAVMKSEAN